MNVSDNHLPNSDTTNITERTELVSRYKRLRSVGLNLNNKLVSRLSKDALHEGGRRLEILHNNTLVFNSEDESSILMDYCLYNVRSKGRNAIEQYLIDSPPDPESDEMACLRAMQHATYSMFLVQTVERGLGVVARDLRSNETVLIIDMGFGSTAKPGLIFASRLLFHDGFAMTGGAALPVGLPPKDQQEAVIAKVMKALSAAAASSDEGLFDPAPLISACLDKGLSSNIQYGEPPTRVSKRQQQLDNMQSAKVGRNDRCPCGSGKKFKHCCMKRS
jgi:hypothetical protein